MLHRVAWHVLIRCIRARACTIRLYTSASPPVPMDATTTLSSFVLATARAPTNIATIKYWGKANVDLNIPINSSVSVTLSSADLAAVTSVLLSPDLPTDRLWLNGVYVTIWHMNLAVCQGNARMNVLCREEDITRSKRVQAVLTEVRERCRRAEARGDAWTGEAREGVVFNIGPHAPSFSDRPLSTWHAHVVSKNTFPTAAGLASSAAGYACLVYTASVAYGLKEEFPGDLSTIARQGSGSACRSMYGGFVKWEMGTANGDGRDSKAVQVASEHHWEDLAILIAVVSDKKKETSSTKGMQVSVATSALLAHRAKEVVPKRLAEIEAAYLARDFETFGRLTMADSNQFHAVCLDSYPPIFYMNDISKQIIGLVHAINDVAGRIIAAYTFDAGPNAVIYTTKANAHHVLAVLMAHFPAGDVTPKPYVSSPAAATAAEALISSLPLTLACKPEAATHVSTPCICAVISYVTLFLHWVWYVAGGSAPYLCDVCRRRAICGTFFCLFTGLRHGVTQ
jgi:diphosphomevalonate decarboxylase